MKAKTILCAFIIFLSMNTYIMAQAGTKNEKADNGNRILVTYFSATGTTAAVAEKIAKAIDATLHTITPVKPYTNDDLNWNDKQSRSSKEMNDPKARPAIAGNTIDMGDYDIVFLGYPIWWNQAPRIINTFIENHDLKGKTVVPFATSGSSSIGNSVKELKKNYPDLNWAEGKLLNHADEMVIRQWAEEICPEMKQREKEDFSLTFPAEHLAPATNNTGEVHLSLLKRSGNTMITHFCFSPGSRNYWHYHPGVEQTLLVLDGEGYYQEEGSPKRLIRKGDVIVSPANVHHWNGATPDKPLICITVTEHAVDGHVVQLRAVTEEEYNQ